MLKFQGVRGAYSESAAEKAYPNCEAVPCEQFDTAFEVNTYKFFFFIIFLIVGSNCATNFHFRFSIFVNEYSPTMHIECGNEMIMRLHS